MPETWLKTNRRALALGMVVPGLMLLAAGGGLAWSVVTGQHWAIQVLMAVLDHTSGVYEFNNDPRVLAPYLPGTWATSGPRAAWYGSRSATRPSRGPALPTTTRTPTTSSRGWWSRP